MFPPFLSLQLVVKVFNGPLCRGRDAEAVMNKEIATMNELQERRVPFIGKVVASTAEWEEYGKKYPAMALKTAGR